MSDNRAHRSRGKGRRRLNVLTMLFFSAKMEPNGTLGEEEGGLGMGEKEGGGRGRGQADNNSSGFGQQPCGLPSGGGRVRASTSTTPVHTQSRSPTPYMCAFMLSVGGGPQPTRHCPPALMLMLTVPPSVPASNLVAVAVKNRRLLQGRPVHARVGVLGGAAGGRVGAHGGAGCDGLESSGETSSSCKLGEEGAAGAGGNVAAALGCQQAASSNTGAALSEHRI